MRSISATSTTVGGKIKLLEGTDNGTNGVTLLVQQALQTLILHSNCWYSGTCCLLQLLWRYNGCSLQWVQIKLLVWEILLLTHDAATKAYVDSTVSHGSTLITQGNSNVTVADSGTGNVTIEVDGTDPITTPALLQLQQQDTV